MIIVFQDFIKKITYYSNKKEVIMHRFNLGKIAFLILFMAFFTNQSYSAITLIEPANNQICVNMNAYFDWDSVLNVDHYNIVLSRSDTFNPDSTWISADIVSDNIYALGTFSVTLMPSTKYYWRVRAVKVGGGTDSSSARAFTTRTDYAVPKSPLDQCCIPISTDFQVETYIDTVDSLRILISTNRDFSTITLDTIISHPVINNSVITAHINLKNPGTYYWTAFQFANGCWSDSVEDQKYTFCTVPAGPALSYPANNSKGVPVFNDSIPFHTNLVWNQINDAFYYIVWTSDSPTFETYTEYFTTDTTVLANFGLINNAVYYWKVAAKVPPINGDDTCQTLFSDAWSLKTPYEAMALLLPQNGSRCVPIDVRLSWDTVFNAIYYRLQVATSKDFADSTVVIDIDSIPQAEQVVSLPSSMTKYYWRVRVDNSSNNGLWSTPFSFESAVIAPIAISPVPDSKSVPLNVNFIWTKGIEGTIYTLQVSDTSNMQNLLLDTLVTDTTVNFAVADFFETYYWRIKAYNLDCESVWSPIYQFKTQIDAPYGLVPPNDSTFVEPLLVKLSWKAPMGALKYDLDIALDTNFTKMFRFERNITALYVIYDNLSDTTDYYWRVRAKNLEGESNWTSTHHFTTGYIRPSVPALIYPTNASKKIPTNVELKWAAANRALTYHLQFATDENFNNILVDSTNLTNLTYSLAGLDNGRLYYWRVEALNLQGSSGYSSVFSFLTIPLPPVGKVQLIAPDSGAINQKATLLLSWDSIPNVSGYHLQIATDPAFNNIVEDNDKVWITSKLVYNLAQNTKFYWRVRGWNDGGVTEWSNIWVFSTEDLSSVPLTNYFHTSVSPSPINDKVNVRIYLDNSSPVQFQFIDLQGKLIMDLNLGIMSEGENVFAVNAAALPAGMYIYKIIANGKEEVGKIIKR